jgi:intein/homing endonuclease
MSEQVSAEFAEDLKSRVAEYHRRVNREKQARRGGLVEFVRYFWKVLEPNTPMVDGWPMEAVCKHLEAITFGEITRLLCTVPPGFCKALDHDTPVFTTWGWKRHGDLAVGDFVFGKDGKPRRIIACSEEMLKDAYEVVFDDGSKIIAGEDHLWEVERDVMSVAPNWRRGRKRMIVKTTGLQPSGYKKGKVDIRPDRISVAEAIEMPPKRLLIDPYLLGAWLGDGASGSGCIYSAQQDIENFSKLGTIGTVYEPSGSRKQTFYRINADGLHAKLKLLDLMKNKHIPEDYLEASVEQRWELLRGLMDTDGTCATNGHCSFSNKNERLARQVHQLACSLGLKATIKSRVSKFNGKTYGIHYLVGFIPPSGVIVFRLKRKQARIIGNQNGRSRNRFVMEVNPIGTRRMKCIQIEGSIYLAGKTFVPTHNSLLTDVFFPAWEWGPMGLSHMRYVAFSYSSSLTERDNGRFRDLIMSPEYQGLWGDVYSTIKIGETKISNNKTGWKLASSVGGVGTGERGNRVICLPWDECILTSDGWLPIGEVVEKRLPVKILGSQDGRVLWQDVEAYETNPGGDIIELQWDDGEGSLRGALRCTRDHLIYVEGRGYTQAKDIKEGDIVGSIWKNAVLVVRGIKEAGREDVTYNVRVSPCHNYFAGGILVHNCDDPHSIKQAESDIVRAETTRWFREAMSNRLNDLATDAIIVIMQRSHDEDVAGVILSEDFNYTVLSIAMEYDATRQTAGVKNEIGWVDPRSEDMELAWPERFPQSVVDQTKIVIGPFAFCTPAESPVLMADLSMKPIGEVAAGDEVVGFETSSVRGGGKRARLRPAKVISVSKSTQPVVKITLDSGEVIRCTEDHRWWTGRNDWPHQEYAPARAPGFDGRRKNGTELLRVCPAKINSRMATTRERVVSIEPDGIENVYGLETETGNYVVWGFASSNSSQYQQLPVPRGGGILQRAWWGLWDGEEARKYGLEWNEKRGALKEFPHCDLIVGSLDTAYGSKQENDYTAMCVFGIWQDRAKNRRAMLMFAWRKRLPLHGVNVEAVPGEAKVNYDARKKEAWGIVEWVADTCKRYKVQRLLIEDRTKGRDVSDELRRIYSKDNWGIELIVPTKDKVSRAHSVVPLMADGALWAPNTNWSEMVIDECVVAGTPIITLDGVIPVEEVKVGDMVLTHKGRFRPVLSTFSRVAKELVCVEPKTLDPITITPEHPFYSFDLSCERQPKGGPVWVAARDMKSRRYATVTRDGKEYSEAKPSACHAVTLPVIKPETELKEIDLRNWATIAAGKKHELLYDHETMTTTHSRSQTMRWRQVLDRRFGRIMGLFLAEGSGRRVRISWSFNVKETEFVNEVISFVEERFGCRARARTQGNCTTVCANLPLLEGFFNEFGKLAHGKIIAPWVWDAPDEFIEGLIDGYMDGDGYDRNSGRHATTVSFSLAWGIRLLALRLGKRATLRMIRKPGTASFGRDRTYETKAAYAVGFLDKQHNEGAAKMIDNYAAYSVMRTSKVEKECEVFNIEVAEDDSYCTTSGLVHNCSRFPKAKNDDLTDCVTQFANWAREREILLRGDEASAAMDESAMFVHPGKSVAEQYGVN